MLHLSDVTEDSNLITKPQSTYFLQMKLFFFLTVKLRRFDVATFALLKGDVQCQE